MSDRKFVVHENERRVSYQSGGLIYDEEMLASGTWVGTYWSADGRLAMPGEGWREAAFCLGDGLSGNEWGSGWVWAGAGATETGAGVTEAVVRMEHPNRNMELAIHTVLDGSPVMTRWLEMTNRGADPLALRDLSVWQGRLWAGRTFTLGYYSAEEWAREGWFEWRRIARGSATIKSDKGQGFNKPFFVLRDEISGEYFALHLNWSANWHLDLRLDDGGLWLGIGPDGLGVAQRVVAQGETVRTPLIDIAHVSGSLDGLVQAMHAHVRGSVTPDLPGGLSGLVQYVLPADQGYYMPFSEESALRCVDVAAEIGTELFILDAYWWDVTPDWTPSRERFPKGLKPLISYVRDKGMRFGLYVEPEAGRAAGQLGNIEQSTVYQEHPDWFGVKNVLRLALPEAAAWMESEICRLIEAYELDLLRIDFNPHFTYGGLISREKGIWESEYWRYYETLYAIYDRVHARYPQLVLQQCAAGGGRNDLAMVRRFHENYLTDGLSLPRELQIYSGVTLGLPPELLRILHGADGMGIVGKPLNLDTILRVSCTLAPPQIFTGAVAPSLEELADSRLDRFKRYITLYKEFIRPDLAGSLVYHHEPVSAGGGVESSPWFCVEFVSPNRDKGWVVVVRMRNGRGDAYVYKYNGEKVDFSEGGELFGEGAEYIFRSRGLDPFKRYRVTYDSLDASGVMSGIEIRRGGLPVRLENAGMSELLRFEAE